MDSIPIPMPSASFSDVGMVVALALFIVFFLLISALLAGAEVAFFSLDSHEKQQLKADESNAAKLVLEMIETPKELLATILIMNTFVNFGVVILTSVLFHGLFPNLKTNSFHFILEIGLITFLLVLLSEVIPKNYAHQNGLIYAKKTASFIHKLGKTPPISWIKKVLLKGTRFVNKYADTSLNDVSSDELEQAINLTIEDGVSKEDQMILEGIIQLGNKDVAQIMRPIEEMVCIDAEHSFSQVLACIIDSGYSRIPIIQSDPQQVIGVLYSKDLLNFTDKPSDFEWTALMREPFYSAADTKIDDLLKSFQELKKHMAIIRDEQHRTIGIATLEDVIEEIVGDITEEFDDVEVDFVKINDDEMLLSGSVLMTELADYLAISCDDFGAKSLHSITFSDYLKKQVKQLIQENDLLPLLDFTCIVEEIEGDQLKKIRILKK